MLYLQSAEPHPWQPTGFSFLCTQAIRNVEVNRLDAVRV
ncbi:hypothetical protein RHOER0001_1516 [Rhodococcus erythropolis SK121]|nr:hypothetical protein RHOER0001_1516 [Rhodococcus erythropolis SK121]